MLRAALPSLDGTVGLPGLGARVEVWRDLQGIPHVLAASAADAFAAQGFVQAQDRLWHMDYDRRRAYGRWAEYVGPSGVTQDLQMRRFRFEAMARRDYARLNAETRQMLDAFAAGVNAFLETTRTLPIEFRLLDARPEPWAPWDSLAVFAVRHADMGVWETKAWRARLLRQLGPERTAWLCPGTQPNPALIVPPGAEYRGEGMNGLAVLAEGARWVARLPEEDSGSNNWAVSSRRTASGRPLVAGDPHRALEVPNVYYQNHLACSEFDVIGLSFPGVPAFPHFGHNPAVAWCVTHTNADCQDLYLERFDPADPTRYECRGEWRHAETVRESIHVRDGAPVDVEVVITHHGPIVLGEPARGHAIALRDIARAEVNATFEAFRPMLRATSAAALEDAMRPWTEPVNNLVIADVDGTIAYRTRGRIPIRPMANAWLPVPGWDGAHEWAGVIPFEEMPAVRDPDSGFLVTANSRVTGPGYPHYIGLDFTADFRTRRLVERVGSLRRATGTDMAAIHADRVSLPARECVPMLRDVVPLDAASREALRRLLAWDGVMEPDSVAAAIYAVLRERLLRDLLTPFLGPPAAEAFTGSARGPTGHMIRLRARLTALMRADDRTLLPSGTDWPTMLSRALAAAVAELRVTLGEDVGEWGWGRLHRTQPRHPLSDLFSWAAESLDPPSMAVGGDGDTVQATGCTAASGYRVTLTSVARYVFDLGDWEQSGWIVPLGASGHPGSPHYADQMTRWGEVELVPMRYGWPRIAAEAVIHQVLTPSARGGPGATAERTASGGEAASPGGSP
jgi:penicillin amidase